MKTYRPPINMLHLGLHKLAERLQSIRYSSRPLVACQSRFEPMTKEVRR